MTKLDINLNITVIAHQFIYLLFSFLFVVNLQRTQNKMLPVFDSGIKEYGVGFFGYFFIENWFYCPLLLLLKI